MHSFEDNNNKSIPKIEECVNSTRAPSAIKISAKKKEEREKKEKELPFRGVISIGGKKAGQGNAGFSSAVEQSGRVEKKLGDLNTIVGH